MKPRTPIPIPRSAAVSSSTSRSAWKYPAASDASQRSLVTKLLRLIPRRAGHSRAPESRQSVTNCHRLKSGGGRVSQVVTNCDQLKTASLGASQPVTNCHRLEIPPIPRAENLQSVTNCYQLKSGVRSIRQSVTKCYQLKTGGVFITQPVTNCYQLKPPTMPGKLIPPP